MKKIYKKVLLIILCFVMLVTSFPFSVYAESNEQIIYNFLKNNIGLNTAAACGVLANIQKESNFRNDVVEYGYTWSSGGGYGICQWTNSPRTSSSGRRTNLVNWCNNNGYDYTTLNGQLNYLKYELNTSYYYNLVTKRLLSVNNDADGAYWAGYYWCYYFEVPSGYNTGVSETRGNIAKTTYWPRYCENVTHTRDTSYGINFTATAKDYYYVYDSSHNQTGYRVYEGDVCTIYEVYTDGCCYFSMPLESGGSMDCYGEIAWFNIQARKTAFGCWFSEKGSGYQYDEAFPNVESGTTQKMYYFWYAIVDRYTQDLYNSYQPGKSYTTTISLVYEDGTKVRDDYTYTNSDNNWIGFTPKKSGTITATITLSGDLNYTTTKELSIDYTAGLRASESSITLDLNGTNTKTISFTPTGGYPGNKGAQRTIDSNILNLDSSGWNDGVYSITISGKKEGTTNVVINLYEAYSGNKEVVATATVTVNVVNTASYTLTYNANGGTGAPIYQTGAKSYTISSTVPTYLSRTFLGWSKSSSATSATYKPGDIINLTSNTTLYAVWKSASTLSTGSSTGVTIGFANQECYYTFTPSTSGTYIFESTGSLDSKVFVYSKSGTQLGSNDDGGSGNNFKLEIEMTAGTSYIIGVRAYSGNTGSTTFTITKKQVVMRGDLNGDGCVDAGDAVLISRYDAGLITLTAAQLEAGDLNNDGYVDAGDAVIISRYDAGLISNI